MKEKIAKDLLEIKAVFLSPNKPFTWSSGIKSPIYCDNRLTLSYPLVRKEIEKGLADLINKNYPKCEIVMGTATAGIPHAALISEILDLPMGYVRSSAKGHGRQKQIEGKYEKNQKVVIVEDLISTGKSAIDTVNILRSASLDVLGVISIFTYDMNIATENFKNANIKYESLTDYNTIIDVAAKNNYIASKDIDRLKQWKENPKDESWIKKD